MANLVDRCFSESDFEAITKAVADAESRTSGEVIIRLASKSRNWLLDRFFAAGIVAIVAVVVSLFVTREQHWGVFYDFSQATLWGAVGFLAGFFGIGTMLEAVTRRRRIVWERALKIFENLVPTRDGTGVLIFVSMKEKIGVIVADKKIAAKVPPEYWNHPQAMLQNAILKDSHSEGIISAVREIGGKMAEHFPRSANDVNEMPDRPEIV